MKNIMPKPRTSAREKNLISSHLIELSNRTLLSMTLPTSYSLPDWHGQERNHPHWNQQAVRHGYWTADFIRGARLDILATRNRKSGNLEVRVLVLGNHLFCAWSLIHFSGDIGQGLAASAVRSSLYQYPQRNYDLVYTKTNTKSGFHTPGQLMENHPEYSLGISYAFLINGEDR